MSNTKHTRSCIDLWRMVFTVLVCGLHSGKLLSPGYDQVYFPGGYIAVEFFFLVSGYFLASSVHRMQEGRAISQLGTETLRYTWDRAKRLFPEFLCGFVLTIVLNQIIYRKSFSYWLEQILTTGMFELPMLHMVNPHSNMILSVAWYVSALLFATFLIYPFLRAIPDLYKNYISPLLMMEYLVVVAKKSGNILIGNFTVYGCIYGG